MIGVILIKFFYSLNLQQAWYLTFCQPESYFMAYFETFGAAADLNLMTAEQMFKRLINACGVQLGQHLGLANLGPIMIQGLAYKW